MKFKVGDKVRCVRTTSDYFGKFGEVYTVKYVGLSTVTLEEDPKKHLLNPSRFEKVEEMKFKVGDKVRCVKTSLDCFGKLGEVYTVRHVELSLLTFEEDPEKLPLNPSRFEKVEEMEYEDDWILMKAGLTVPEGADVSLSKAGHVVAFRPLKKPKIEEFVRWVADYPQGGTNQTETEKFRNKIIFVVTDGVISDVRLEKPSNPST